MIRDILNIVGTTDCLDMIGIQDYLYRVEIPSHLEVAGTLHTQTTQDPEFLDD